MSAFVAGLLSKSLGIGQPAAEQAKEQWRNSIVQDLRQESTRPERDANKQSFKEKLGSSRFEYTPLDVAKKEIRILYIREAEDADAPLEAIFRIHSLDDWPVHHCLSYVWGMHEAERSIQIGDDRHLEITATLEKALQRYRTYIYADSHPPDPFVASLNNALQHYRAPEDGKLYKPIWVDGICIDQANVEERNSQIPLMRQIYETAWGVFAYLGEARVQSAPLDTLAVLDEVVKHFPMTSTEEGFLVLPKAVYDKKLEELGVDATYSDRAIVEVLCRPWFSRIWIVQEATVNWANKVKLVLGDTQFSLSSFWRVASQGRLMVSDDTGQLRTVGMVIEESMHAVTLMRNLAMNHSTDVTGMRAAWERMWLSTHQLLKTSNPPCHALLGDEHEFLEAFRSPKFIAGPTSLAKDVTPSSHGLLYLLGKYRFLNATNPRDKIYALLGLATDAQDAPPPSYDRSVDQVYLDYALYFQNKGQSLDLLHAAAEHPQRTLSWVPNWSTQVDDAQRHTSSFRGIAESSHWRAGGSPDIFNACSDASTGSCVIKGCIIDTITYLEKNDTSSNGGPLNTMVQSFALFNSALNSMIVPFLRAMSYIKNTVPLASGSFDVASAFKNDHLHLFPPEERDQWFALILNHHLSPMVRHKHHFVFADDAVSLEEEHAKLTAMYAEQGRSDTDTDAPAYRDPIEMMFRHALDTFTAGMLTLSAADHVPFRYTNQKLLQGRKICFTEKGYMGLVPASAEEGDVIAVFAGASVPFLLRKKKADAEEGYLLAGEAYLRGFMRGAVVPLHGAELLVGTEYSNGGRLYAELVTDIRLV